MAIKSFGRLHGIISRMKEPMYTKKGDPWLPIDILEKDPKGKADILWKLVTFDKHIVNHLATRYAEGMALVVEARPKANPYTSKHGVKVFDTQWTITKIIETVPDTSLEQHLEQESAPLPEDYDEPPFQDDDIPF